ncbi:uroporphyrinogen-III synthase [Alteromonas gracilis]|uniref:uroporphyrinogen-III synthase n=1 Tax=Alteromonas gracilis TaxID=1479524 RepID=UPI003736CB3A
MLLFTRPLPKLKASALAFEKAGINAVGVATSDIVTVSSEQNAAASFLSSNTVNAIVVTSVYAVEAVVSGLNEASNHSAFVIAVGDATGRKLKAKLTSALAANVITPEVHTSEGILAMHQLNEANCRHVVIIKGEGGRDAIAKGLDEKGILVNSFSVYKREQLTRPVYTKRWKMGEVSGIIATSEAMALQLIEQFGNALLAFPWLTVSDRIAQTLNKKGITNVAVCQQATDQALIAWVKDNWEY